MKKFIFALLTFIFTSFAFASPPKVESKQKVKKVEFVKQVASQVTVFTETEKMYLYNGYSKRKVSSYKDISISTSYFSPNPININPVPITNSTEEYDYVIDKRNLLRICSKWHYNI